MRIRVPSKKTCERFFLTYELKGCQKAVDFLTKYYGVRRMKIVVDGRRAGNGNIACYFENAAYFTKEGLNVRLVLHELYHHLVHSRRLELPYRVEEANARIYAKELFACRRYMCHPHRK